LTEALTRKSQYGVVGVTETEVQFWVSLCRNGDRSTVLGFPVSQRRQKYSVGFPFVATETEVQFWFPCVATKAEVQFWGSGAIVIATMPSPLRNTRELLIVTLVLCSDPFTVSVAIARATIMKDPMRCPHFASLCKTMTWLALSFHYQRSLQIF
jgi:hypothetical protein